MDIKSLIDHVLVQEYAKGEIQPNEEYRDGYLQAIENLIRILNLTVGIDDPDVLLEQDHNAIIYFQNSKMYRLDKSDTDAPYLEPVLQSKSARTVKVNSRSPSSVLFPGILIISPNYIPRW